jgi:DNA-directed RNA polymerase specialized sigma24 family protein
MNPTGKMCADDRMSWDDALGLYREQLRFYLDYLIDCDCDDAVLADVESEVKNRYVPDEFKFRFMTRALTRHVIQHMRECTQSGERLDSESDDWADPSRGMPALERLVYFMRDILEYSKRDTSLLIGITDAQTERRLAMARKRLDLSAGSSTLKIESSHEIYFKWNFANLHLRSKSDC